jgi:sRNA-binding regulator protein Hfq
MTPDTDRTQNTDLEALARARFTKLTAAEIKLLQAAPKGEVAVCGPTMNDDDPANDPSKAEEWGADRQIRADLIRWLCVDRHAKELVDPKGIRAFGAKLTGALDLSFVTVPFGLTLWHCRLMEPVNLPGVEIPQLDLQGTWLRSIMADGAKVKGDVFLRNGFRAEGEVRLLGAQIGGNLECDNATFKNLLRARVAGTGVALSADGIAVTGSVFLRNRFHAEGEVRLLGAQIGGPLSCVGGTFKNPLQPGVPGTGMALSADRAVVKGSVFLSNGFRAEGEVRLPRAQIGADLDCSSAMFGGELNAEGTAIKGGLLWRRIVHPELAKLDLINASVAALADDAQSWPAPGNLILDGFVYERISSGPRDAETRLDWLARQKDFTPQPYRQLAKVLRDEGNDAGARLVLFEMEHRRRKKEDRGWFARTWSRILRRTIGYGYYPEKALWWLAGLTALGLILFWGGYAAGSIAPTDKDAYGPFKQNSHLPPHYESFYASIYSLENALPLVKLGQVDRWQPDPNREWVCKPAKWVPRSLCVALSPTPLRWFRWAQICLGWILATLFVAGVTGIVRKD